MNEDPKSALKQGKPALATPPPAPNSQIDRAVQSELYANFIKRQIVSYATLPAIWAIPALMALHIFPLTLVALWWVCASITALACLVRLRVLQNVYVDGRATKRTNFEILLLVLAPSLVASLLPLLMFPSAMQSLNFVILLSCAGVLVVNAGVGVPNSKCFAAAALPQIVALSVATLRTDDPFLLGFLVFFILLAFSSTLLAEMIRKDRQKHIESRFHLAEALEAMRAANTAKSQFLAAMSHELRTPLNAIMGFSEVIATQTLGPVGSVKYLEYAKDIHFSGSHLLNLINDVLDLSKIEAGKIEIVRCELDPLVLIQAATRMIAPRARENNVAVRTIFDAYGLTLFADERAATQILLNVMSNAVKFNRPGGEVVIECKNALQGGVLFVVKDTGPGVAEDQIERLFEPFEQGENSFNRGKGGTGLGLAIVRSLMKMHGGAVWMESQLGEGATVYVHFPNNPEGQSEQHDIRRVALGRS